MQNTELIIKIHNYAVKLDLIEHILSITNLDKARTIIKTVTDIDLDDLENVI